MKVSYNWLKWYVPDVPPAQKLADILTYHLTEVESVEENADGDFILDVNVLPNRAHDLLSHQGLAREVASLLNIDFIDPTSKYKVPKPKSTNLKIEIKTQKDRRHVGRIVRNVKVGPSPEWVVKHLESIGQRSINNIVDATNITMFDCGQPTHAFDLGKVEGEKLTIRDAQNGEKVTLLTGEEKELAEGMIAITDGKGNILDTGIKGGKYAEITNSTVDLLLEADNFDPVFARKTGQALNIFTDARKRFENDLSPELAPYAMQELSALVLEMCPDAVFEDIVDTYPTKQKERKVSFRLDRVSQILGLEVSADQVKDVLKRYNIKYTDNGGEFEINVPPMRLDLEIEEDMAEEIGRVLGYDKVKPLIPKINFEPKVNDTYAKISWARNKLLMDGYHEVMNTSFSHKGEVEVEKSASDKNFLRTNLTDGFKESLKLNQANAPLLCIDEVKIFEIGTVFRKRGEEMRVVYGDKKNVVEVSLDDYCKDMPENFSLEPRTLREPEGSSEPRTAYNLKPNFQMWSLFPFIARDIAVWVPEGVGSKEVSKIIKDNAGELLVRGPDLFDEFKKSGQISYAFKLVFQSENRTLTDAEVGDIMTKIANKIKAQKTNEGTWQVR